MVMKNAKTVNYWQVDNRKPSIKEEKGLVILPSGVGFEKYEWVRKYFDEKPEGGYFVWIRKSIKATAKVCLTIENIGVKQNLENLIVVEEGVKAKLNGSCFVCKKNLKSEHVGKTQVVLGVRSKLIIEHYHRWGGEDRVKMFTKVNVGQGAECEIKYKCLEPAKIFEKTNQVRVEDGGKVRIETKLVAENSDANLIESVDLMGDNSEAVVRLRLVGKKGGRIKARSTMTGKNKSSGHVDCMGLVVDKKAEIEVVPSLKITDDLTSLTHEAAVGRISKKKLEYLRSKGLDENEAIDLIIGGFLE